MTEGASKWFDASTLEYSKNHWRMAEFEPSPHILAAIRTAKYECLPSGRYVHEVKISFFDNACHITFQNARNKGAGCRSAGEILEAILLRCGTIDRLPRTVFVTVMPHFKSQGLLTLKSLADVELRFAVLREVQRDHLPQKSSETAELFQERAVEFVICRHPGFQRCQPNELRIPGVQSEPDGLLLSPDNRVLVIVEAKKRKVSFSEGPMQLVNYFAQTRCHSRFCRIEQIKLHLVTPERHPGEGYLLWKRFMESGREIEFVIQGSDIAKSW